MLACPSPMSCQARSVRSSRMYSPRVQWKNPQREIIQSCTILTTTPNTLVADIHDRMPVIVTPDKYGLWLSPEVEDFDAVREILRPYDPGLMRHYPVSTRINHVTYDDEACSSPVELAQIQTSLFIAGQ